MTSTQASKSEKTEQTMIAKRPRGRPRITEALGITLAQIVAVYNSSRSERAAAKKMGFTHRTLRKYLHAAGVFPEGTQRISRTGRTYKPSAMYHWIRSKNGVIPRDARIIALESGIKEVTVRKFLGRRKEAALTFINNLGELREVEGKEVYSVKGQRIATKQIAQSMIRLDLYNLNVTLSLILRSGVSAKCIMSFNEYRKLFPSEENRPINNLEQFVTTESDLRASSPSW